MADLVHVRSLLLLWLHHACCQLLQSVDCQLITKCHGRCLCFLFCEHLQKHETDLSKAPDVGLLSVPSVCLNLRGKIPLGDSYLLDYLLGVLLEAEGQVKVDQLQFDELELPQSLLVVRFPGL